MKTKIPRATFRFLLIKKIKKLLTPDKVKIPRNQIHKLRVKPFSMLTTTQKGSKTIRGIKLKNDVKDRNITLLTI